MRRLTQRLLSAGPHRFDWDGREVHGREVAHGIYFLKLTSRTLDEATKVAKLNH